MPVKDEKPAEPEEPTQVNAIDLVGTAAPVGEPDYARFVARPESNSGGYEVWDIQDERRADGPFLYKEDADARAALVAIHKAREVR